MKYIWTILILLLLVSPVLGAVPKMESTRYLISSSEFSAMGKYKSSATFDTWDTLGQPTAIGAWLAENQSSAIGIGGQDSGAGWIYTISKPIFYDKDRDRDGMPQAFEEQFAAWTDSEFNVHTLSDFNPTDAAGDFDGDGFYNIQEYLARTDPTNPSSFFQFTDIRITTEDGLPTLVWQNPTIKISGMESEYPNYPRSLGFDVLYANWSRSSQLTGEFPSENWFNLTGTWQLHPNGLNLPRDPDSEDNDNIKFKDTTASTLANKAIRFYRLAIAGTWDQGEPVVVDPDATWRYYTEAGDYFLASTLAREVLLVQKHNITAGWNRVILGAAGHPAGNQGDFNLFLGTDFFPSDYVSAAQSTVFGVWMPEQGTYLRDYLGEIGFDQGWVDEDGGQPSGRTVPGDDGFILWSSEAESFPALSFYAGATLNSDSYYHDVYRRHDAGPWLPAYNPDVSYYWRATLINYNYPVSHSFTADPFPAFAGTTSPAIAGWQGFESDWVVFYDQDLSSRGGSSNTAVVIIYYDHVTNHAWTYFAPLGGEVVGSELKFNPGSPVALIQYWNPDSPTAWSAHTVGFGLPYQKETAEIKSYLQMVDD